MDDGAFFFLYGGGFPKGLRVCDVCGDSVIVGRFVCTVENSADSFRNIYLHALYIYLYMLYIYVYVIHPSVALQPLLGPGLPQKMLPFFCLLLVHTHRHTHTHTHTHIYIYIMHISTHRQTQL